jgi:hypothetical protein
MFQPRPNATLEKMKSAGWVSSYALRGTGYDIQWTEDRLAAIEAVWSLMGDMGTIEQGCDEDTWTIVGPNR